MPQRRALYILRFGRRRGRRQHGHLICVEKKKKRTPHTVDVYIID